MSATIRAGCRRARGVYAEGEMGERDERDHGQLRRMRRMRTALTLANVAGLVMLLRSVALDRWISVFAAALLLTGVAAARRNRTWGVALSFASAAAFPVFVAIGIAPPWFLLVGALGMLPFAVAARSFAKFDKTATVLLAAIGASLGGLLAVGWSQIAPSLFDTLPFIRPSYYAHHGFALLGITGMAIAASVRRRRKEAASIASSASASETSTHYRIAERVRVASTNDSELAYADEFEAEEEALNERPLSQPNTNASAVMRDASAHQPKRAHPSRS